MAVWTLGLNHKTAPIDLRERFAFASERMDQSLKGLRQSFATHKEVAILSTCNRTEIYCAGDEVHIPQTLSWLADAGQTQVDVLARHTYRFEGDASARHAFRVASGLDSMVLGESQILGQLKEAVRTASDSGALGTTLNQLFQRSFAVAKEVRSTTEIGAHSISMAAAAVRLAGRIFENIKETNILFVGAGEMIELVVTHFAAKNPRSMVIANRSMGRGEKLADRFGAEVMLDMIDGRKTPATQTQFVQSKPLPFPPEPFRFIGIQTTRWALNREDKSGKRNLWLRSLDRLGLGFDS